MTAHCFGKTFFAKLIGKWTKKMAKNKALLNLILIHIKSYIKDNLDFPAKCSRGNKWDIILTFDVVGLYSNFPHEYDQEAIEYWLDKLPEFLHPRFPENLF